MSTGISKDFGQEGSWKAYFFARGPLTARRSLAGACSATGFLPARLTIGRDFRPAPIPAGLQARTMLAPRLNEGRHRDASRWCEPGVVSGLPCQGRSARCGQLGSSLEPRSGKLDTTRGVRASMDCPVTSEPGIRRPAPSVFLRADTRIAGTSGRNGACARGWPAGTAAAPPFGGGARFARRVGEVYFFWLPAKAAVSPRPINSTPLT
jgi:hypothetical protein